MRQPTEMEITVAKAICAVQFPGKNPEEIMVSVGDTVFRSVVDGGPLYHRWEPLYAFAVAAIRSMREPTESMMAVRHDHTDEEYKTVEQLWQAMIDAASPPEQP